VAIYRTHAGAIEVLKGGDLRQKLTCRARNRCVLGLLFGFTITAQAEPVGNAGPQRIFAQSAVSSPQDISPNSAHSISTPATPREDGAGAEVRPSVDAICEAIASAAARNTLPLAFFSRLIWQESRFDPLVVSSKGARGIAQFMPATAAWRGLQNPFDPMEAIAKAAQLLDELRREFGNIGLAAAAYNAGSGRVRQWLARRQTLPHETQQYVRVVTGQSAEDWRASAPATSELATATDIPCRPREDAAAAGPTPQTSAAVPAPHFDWAVQLAGSSSRTQATLAWTELKQRYTALLAGREPLLVETKLSGGISWYRVRIGADGLERANDLCAHLRGAGANCLVQRN
jgi:Transglycosylase SLT domain/SPOR domain